MSAARKRAGRAPAHVTARSRGRHARGSWAQSPPKGGRSAPPVASVRGTLQRATAVPAFVNFAAGGAAIAVLGAALLEALVRAGSAPLVAQAVQLTVTLALNFTYNYKITWRDRPRTGLPRQAAWFLVTRGLTQVASWFGFAVLTSAGLHYQLANALCLAGAMAINFVTSDKLVFRKGGAAKATAAAAHAKPSPGHIPGKSFAAP